MNRLKKLSETVRIILFSDLSLTKNCRPQTAGNGGSVHVTRQDGNSIERIINRLFYKKYQDKPLRRLCVVCFRTARNIGAAPGHAPFRHTDKYMLNIFTMFSHNIHSARVTETTYSPNFSLRKFNDIISRNGKFGAKKYMLNGMESFLNNLMRKQKNAVLI